MRRHDSLSSYSFLTSAVGDEEDPVPQLKTCEAFSIMMSDFPELKDVFEESLIVQEEEPVYL